MTVFSRLTPVADMFTGKTPVAPAVSDNVQALRDRAAHLETEADQARAEAEAKALEARQLQKQLERLQRDVDLASEHLINADGHNSQFQTALISAKAAKLQAWGMKNGYGEIMPPPDYAGISAMTFAVGDYPRVRKFLVEKLNVADVALQQFNRANNLSSV